MPRPKTIIIDPQKLLAGIHAETLRQLAELGELIADCVQQRADGDTTYSLQKHQHFLDCEQERIRADGVVYDLPAFCRRSLTPSERIKHQAAIRQLEADGLVEILGLHARNIKLTPDGLKALSGAISTP